MIQKEPKQENKRKNVEIKNAEETEKQHYIRHGWQKKDKNIRWKSGELF